MYGPSNHSSSLFLILEYRKIILLRIIWIHSITVSSFVNLKDYILPFTAVLQENILTTERKIF